MSLESFKSRFSLGPGCGPRKDGEGAETDVGVGIGVTEAEEDGVDDGVVLGVIKVAMGGGRAPGELNLIQMMISPCTVALIALVRSRRRMFLRRVQSPRTPTGTPLSMR
jgi:hypothetical protein